MKTLLAYWREFHRQKGIRKQILSLSLLLLILFIFNYSLDFEDSYIDSYKGSPLRILWFFLFNGIAYLLALYAIGYKVGMLKKLPIKYTLLLISALLVLSIDRSLYQHAIWLRDLIPHETYLFYIKIMFNAQSLITVVLAIFLIWKIDRPNEQFGVYGLRTRGVNWKLYLYLFLIMIPVIFLACLIPDIQEYYPTYKRSGGDRWADFLNVHTSVAVILYEIAYLLDFVAVELLFRGLFVIGLSRFLGKNVVFPMVVIYAMLHFGKPMAEAISSVFGGYILGILAFYSRNIWGGIVLHGGIALLMEVFAYLI